MEFAYYPGCSLHSSGREYDISARAVAQELGIGLNEIPGWNCCGATPAHVTVNHLALALPIRNLLLARSAGQEDVAVCCAACFSRLKVANHRVAADQETRQKVAEITGEMYAGEVRVRHFLDIIVNEYGLEALGRKIRHKLSGLKAACYYGCLLVRPGDVMQFDDTEDPQIMDRLVTALGAEAVEWPCKVECCGASLSLTRTDAVLRLCHEILNMAKEAGADYIVVACPLCHSNLDLRQRAIEKAYGTEINMPIVYFTQLMGLAMGIPQHRLGLAKHFVKPKDLLEPKRCHATPLSEEAVPEKERIE